MSAETPMVTVYRSMDATAEDDCNTIIDLLVAEGLSPILLDDTSPGVPSGAYEVQVPASDQPRAETIISENPLPDEVEEVDDSHYLDLSEAIFHSEGSTTAEFEAMEIKNILESNGVAAVIIGDSVLPNFPFEVRVAAENVERARQLIEEAQRSGPEAAEQGARESGAFKEPGTPVE